MKPDHSGKEKAVVAGYDIGGAHLKVARAEHGRIVAAATFPMPLWQGLDRLHEALAEAASLTDGADRHAVTMTGELADLFADRKTGVEALLAGFAQHAASAETSVYAGQAGFLLPAEAMLRTADVASANWHATAELTGRLRSEALLVDMGSTTTDLLPIMGGRIDGGGHTDAERLARGALVYTGFTRTFLCAVTRQVPLRGGLTPLMNEYFASMADVFRILGVLDEAHDVFPAADGKAKDAAHSMIRLARMVGRDKPDLPQRDWTALARWFAECQLRDLHDAALRVAHQLPDDAPVVAAGIGRWQIARLAARLERPLVDWQTLVPSDPALDGTAIAAAAPACAVALLVD